MASKVLLIVLDGMGWPQWSVIRDACDLKILSSSSCLAMVPTLTPFSRQAIFAGAPPLEFPDSLDTNKLEGQRWTEFWSREGFDVGGVRYTWTSGGIGSNIPATEDVRIAGVVIMASDRRPLPPSHRHLHKGNHHFVETQTSVGHLDVP